MIATPEGQVFIVSCSGDSICLDLGEPVRAFHIGLYSTELTSITSTSLLEATTSTRSEIDLCQSNSAFELALDLKSEDHLYNNTLCFVFWSSITYSLLPLKIKALG